MKRYVFIFFLCLSLLISGCSSSIAKKDLEEPEVKYSDIVASGAKAEIERLLKQSEKEDNPYLKEADTLLVDLDGDEQEENIVLKCDEWGHIYSLTINNKTIIDLGNNIDGQIKLLDIDKSDNFHEIAIPESGPSGDYFVTFYKYNNNEILRIGKLGGRLEDLELRGDGKISAKVRGGVVHTWFYFAEYEFKDDKFELIPPADGLYSMNNYPVKVKKSIPIYEKPGGPKLLELEVGKEIRFLQTDDKEWVLIETEKGEQGWLGIKDFSRIKGTKYSTWEVFEGLNGAD